tara:strand:- start:3493 stop:6786 length:3294 start_codon:yes stop_codon:yes gene_type:complete
MVQFIKSKQTTFVNKPVGINRIDTGAQQLGNSIAEFGKTLQNIAWTEAKRDAIASDIEQAKTLPILDANNNFKFEKGNFTKVGQAKAQEILEARYANKLMNLAKSKFATLHSAYPLDKDGFDNAAKDYIKGHVDSFKKNGMGSFIPAFLDKIQGQATYHSNKILNDKLDEDERIAAEDVKINIFDEIKTLEGLNYNYRNIIGGPEADESSQDLEEDIRSTEKYILDSINSLKGKKHGLKAPAINDLKRQMRIYSTQGIINQIIDKNPNDDKIIKIMENVFQTGKITPVQEAYVRFSGNKINLQDLTKIASLNKEFNYSYSDRDYITRYLSNRSGDAAAENVDLADFITANEFAGSIQGQGLHQNSDKNREGYNKGISSILGFDLDINSFISMSKNTYEQLISFSKRSTILPESLHNLYKNTRPMGLFAGMSNQNKQIAAAKMFDFWQQTAYKQGLFGGRTARFPDTYKEVYKRMDHVKSLVDIMGQDSILDAFDIATALPETMEKMNDAVRTYADTFDLDSTATANDIIKKVLDESDIPPEFHTEYKPYVRYKLFTGTVKLANGKEVRFDKSTFIESLNNTYLNTVEEDDVTISLYGNKMGGVSRDSYKLHYKDPNQQRFFTTYVQNVLDVNNNYVENEAGDLQESSTQYVLGDNVALLPDYRNRGGKDKIFTVVDSVTKQPVLSQAGTYIHINTADVDKEMMMNNELFKKEVLAKDYKSTTLTDENKTTLINRIKASPNIMEINGLGQQYYGINPDLDKALEDKGYNPDMNLINSSQTTTNQDEDENVFSKGINYLIDLFRTNDVSIQDLQDNIPDMTVTGTKNPAWVYIYDKVINEPSGEKKDFQITNEAVEKHFDEEVAIDTANDFIRNLNYVRKFEGHDGTAYVDGDGKNATISFGAGFNARFITDDEMALLSPRGQEAVNKIKTLLNDGMDLERIATAIDTEYGVFISKDESEKIFKKKMMDNYEMFVKKYPMFTTISVDKQMALLDHAYQMGFGPKGGFKNYWRNVERALTEPNSKHRAFYFARAGAHLLYNYTTDDQNIIDGQYLTGKTLLSQQTTERAYDRAALLGYNADTKPSFLYRKSRDLIKSLIK